MTRPVHATPLAVSAYIICKDEQASLGDCLDSLAAFSDIVLVDSGSTDGTLDLIKARRVSGMPIRLFERDWPGYAAQKQFALEQCREEWCLNVDADERVDADLLSGIAAAVGRGSSVAAWRVRRREWLPGYGYAHPWVPAERLVRLVRRGSATYDTSHLVHESLKVTGRTTDIERGVLLHRQNESAKAYFDKQNRYTTLKVQERLQRGKRAKPWKMLVSPVTYFLKSYLLRRHFLCGWAGFATAVMSAQYAFQTELKHWRAGLRED